MNQNYHLLAKASSAFARNVRSGATQPPESSGQMASSWRCSLLSIKPFYYLLMFILLFNAASFAQSVTAYSLTSGTDGTLDAMSGSTQLVAASSDDGNSSLTNIGFSFNFAGSNYTQFAASANGFIRLGATPATGSTNYTNSASNGGSQSPVIMPYWDDLATGVGGKVHYVLSGSSPNRILKVEWFVTVPRATTGNANAKFQCWLYEGTNEIKFIYGSGMLANSSNSGYSIGIMTGSTVYQSIVAGVGSTTTFATTTTAAINSGVIYTLTPPLPCSGTPNGGAIATTNQVVCTGSTPAAIAATGYSAGIAGLSNQWEQSTNGGVDWANAVGGSGATTGTYTPPSFAGSAIQYRLKVTCANSGEKGYSNAATIAPASAPATQASAATITNYNQSSATVTWTAGNGNRRMVVISNTAIVDPTDGSAAALTANAVYAGSGQQIVYDGTATSVRITGLTAGTYNVKVYDYQRCGSSAPYSYYYNVTTGTNAVVINNACAAISSFPWTEGFEGVTTATTVVNTAVGLPNCWTSQSTQWSTTSDVTYNTARTGTKYLRYAWSTTNAYIWTPGFQLQEGVSYDFSFYAQGDGYSSWINDVYVNTSVSATGATQLTPSYSPTGSGSASIQAYNKVTRTFVPTATGVYYFAIRGNESTGSPWYMSFDDLEVRLTPNCVSPSALTANVTSGTAVNVSWSAPATGTTPVGYEYAVTTSATAPASGTFTTNTSISNATITPNTTYYLHVRSVCEAGVEYSSWSTSAPFKYLAGDTCAWAVDLATLTSPYSGTTVGFSNDVVASCGSTFTTSAPDAYYSIVVPANYTLNIGLTASNFDSARSLLYGTCGNLTQLQCRDTETTIETWSNYTGSAKTVYYIIDGYSSGSGTFTLTWSLVPPPPCIPPSALTATVNNTSAVVSWGASDSDPDNGYQYEVRSSGAAGSGNTGLVASGTTTELQTTTINGLTIAATYTAYVRSVCSDTESSTWASKSFLVPVPNDDCANAITISCGQTLSGTTVGSTNENMPVCGISGVTTQSTAGVWYKFTGDGSDVTLTTCFAGAGDTRIAVYTGVCGTMTCITGNDDNGACTANTVSSEVLFSTVNGTEYYILMYNWNTTSPFQLSMSCVVPCTPATTNDECASAATVTLGTPLVSGNSCSTPSTGVAYPSCGSSFATYYDAWYKFNSGSNTILEVALNNATSKGFILYSGTCGTLTAVSGSCVTSGAATNVTLTADTDYYIRVYSTSSGTRGTYDVSVKVPCIRPTGVASSAVTINTATISWVAPTSGAPGGGYEYEVRTSGAAGSGLTGLAATGITANTTVNLTALAADTQHSVYVRSLCGEGDNSPWTTVVTFTTLPSCPKPTAVTASNVAISTATIGWTAPTQAPSNGYVWEVRSSGAAGSGSTGLFATSTTTGTSVNVTALLPVTTYAVYVRSSCDNGDLGAWTTAVTFKTKVANDICSGAIAVTCGSTVSGSTTDATNENMAVCGISGVTAQNTSGVWYKYVSNGTDVTFSTCSTTNTGDSRIAVYSGSCGSLTCVGGNDDNSSCTGATLTSEVVISNTTPGATYYILVYAFSSNALTFDLTTTCAPACSPAAGNNESLYAQSVQLGSTTATHNTCASASLGYTYPSCGSSFATYYDTWYKFNSGANTSVIVSSTAISPVVVGYALYTGSPSSLTQVSNSCSTTGSATTVTGLTPHTVYYIRAFSTSTAARGNFNLSVTVPCNAPTGLSTVATTTSLTASWTAATPAPGMGYQYELRTSGAAGSGSTGLFMSGNVPANNINITGLAANTSYSMYVRSVCDTGYYSNWTSASVVFTGYCVPAPTSAAGAGITNVSFDTVNNTTAGEAGNYADYTAMSGTGLRSETVTVNVTHATAQFTKIWVDWNNDMDFDDAGETVYTSTSAGTTAAATFTIPGTTSLGNHRMRIAGGAASTVTACFTGANASFEDYTLVVDTMGVAHLFASLCNSTVNSFNQDIFANNVQGATGYRFRVVSQLGTQVLEVTQNKFKLNMLSNYAYGVTYLVDVSAQVDGVWSDYGTACKLFTNSVPTTSLKNCGIVIDNFNTVIYANDVQGATTYRFKVVGPAGTYEIDRPLAYFKLNMLPVYTYGTTYTVSVNILSGGIWSGYGSACNISTVNQMPSTQLRDADCGITVSSMSQVIYATRVVGAEMYNFTVSSSSGTHVINSVNPYIKLNMVPGYDYNEQYTISVTASATGIITSDPGASCIVSSPATLPLTNLRSVDCGATIANRNTYIYSSVVAGAQVYRFRIVSGSGTYFIDRTNMAYFKFSQLPFGAVASGETVAISVMTISPNGTQSAYGSVCNVTLSSLSGRPGADTDAETNVSAKGYPNPFTETFTIDLTSDSEEMVDIVVYDMTGKLVDTIKAEAAQLPTLKLGGNLAAGVYNLIVTQGGTVKTIRVVKNVN